MSTITDRVHDACGSEMRKYVAREGPLISPSSTTVYLTCPWCDDEVFAYRWSLAGSGKRCTCGILFTDRDNWAMDDKNKYGGKR